MFVLPIFLKPGKNDFIIRAPEDQEVLDFMSSGDEVEPLDYQTQEDIAFKFHYKRNIVPVREE